MRAEIAQAKADSFLAGAGIDPIFGEATLADFADRPALVTIAETALSNRTGVFIAGPVGTGKSHYAAAILRTAIDRGAAGLFLTVPDLLLAIRGSFGKEGGPTEAQMLHAAGAVDWLVLDDAGVEVGTTWAQQEVYQLVNARYVNLRPLIVTSNLRLDELASDKHLGVRTVSRLRQMCELVAFNGPDRRLKRGRG